MQNPSKSHLHVYKSGSDGNKTMYKELYHHGILGQRWGKRNGPPYPLGASDHSQHEKKAGWRKSLSKTEPQTTTKRTHKERRGLSDSQKTAIKVGVGLIATALVAYGGYRLYKSDLGQQLVSNVLKKKTSIPTSNLSEQVTSSLDTQLKDAPKIDVEIPIKSGEDITKWLESTVDRDVLNKELSDKQWRKSLTKDERKTITAYTDVWYHSLNGLLRSKNGMSSNYYMDAVKSMDSAIDKYDLKKETTFIRYSSSSLLGGVKTKEDVQKMIGNVIHDDGYMSSTIGSDSVDELIGKYKQVKYLIKTPPGKGVGAYLEPVTIPIHKGENEFVFGRGSDFEIVGVAEEAGKLVVGLLYKGVTRSDVFL